MNIDRNIANDTMISLSSSFQDAGNWFLHILTVIWGS